MTVPWGNYPDGTFDDDLSGLNGLNEASWRASLNARVIGSSSPGQPGFNGLFGSIVGTIFNTVDDPFISQLPIITDHTRQITDLREAFDQMLLQGNAQVFTSNYPNYIPSPNIVSLDVILIGAGGGGSSGRWDAVGDGRQGGAGGGGGGEVHTTIPASLLPKNPDGTFKAIPIYVGQGGQGANTGATPGGGGGNTAFGTYLTAGGGNGATASTGYWVIATGGAGGVGMIPGGKGGNGAWYSQADQRIPAESGGNSSSAYDLHGGGGGGGGGGHGFQPAFAPGGAGGISPGGASPGAAGSTPSAVVATGGGGGAGSNYNTGVRGGAGAAPGGGGGGGCSAPNSGGLGFGGNGGAGIVFVIERAS
ncbi:hypothetical protein GS532_07930 [Rhodococcus hoagii]|nr:hypothetical protein [Prescottella equi]